MIPDIVRDFTEEITFKLGLELQNLNGGKEKQPCERTAEAKEKKKRNEIYAYGGASGP